MSIIYRNLCCYRVDRILLVIASQQNHYLSSFLLNRQMIEAAEARTYGQTTKPIFQTLGIPESDKKIIGTKFAMVSPKLSLSVAKKDFDKMWPCLCWWIRSYFTLYQASLSCLKSLWTAERGWQCGTVAKKCGTVATNKNKNCPNVALPWGYGNKNKVHF